MPLYFFHLRADGIVARDESEGQDLPDLEAARQEGIGGLRDIVAERIRSGEPVSFSQRVEIADETGEVLLTVPFGDAVTVLP
jgi:hypothetical protein